MTSACQRRLFARLFFACIALFTLSFCGFSHANDFDLVEVAKIAKPAVVSLTVYANGEEKGAGTGFFVSDSGLVATNFHVIRGASRITITRADQQSLDCIGIAGFDEKADLALLGTGLKGVAGLIISGSTPLVGERIAVIGSPRGFDNTLSDGIVSALRKRGASIDEIQMTAPVSPGSSGSPVLNKSGHVVGIAARVSKNAEAVNFAVSSKHLNELLAARFTELKPLASLPGFENAGTIFAPDGSNYSVAFSGTPKLSKSTGLGLNYDVAYLFENGVGLRAAHNVLPSHDRDSLRLSMQADLERGATAAGIANPTIHVAETELGLVGTFMGTRSGPEGDLFIRSDAFIEGQSMMTLLTLERADRSPTMEATLFRRSLKMNRKVEK